MITKVQVENFKSISQHDEIELRPLTIITGPNSAGKSNLLEGIGAFTQRAVLRSAPYNLESVVSRGDYFQYPKIDFIAHRKDLSLPIKFGMEFELTESDKDFLDSGWDRIGYEAIYTPDSGEVKQEISLGGRRIIGTTYSRTKEGGFRSFFVFPRLLKEYSPRSSSNEILNENVFSPIPEIKDKDVSLRVGTVLRQSRLATWVLLRLMRRVFFISAIRGDVPIAPSVETVPTWVGKNGEHTLSLLALICSKREHRRTASRIISWAEKFGLSSLGGGWWGGDRIGVDYVDPAAKKALELALASQGSRQALALITQLCWGQPDDVLMVEEPEISLHPANQLVLQELFGEIASEGKQIICTTHSPIFVLGLSKIVRKKILSQKDIRVLHTEKTEKGTKFTPLPLTEDGYVKGWIPSFTGAEDQLLKEWGETLGD